MTTLMLRSGIERRVARLRALGWRGALEIEGDTLRRLLKSTLAATLAWEAASLLNSPRPVLASLAAIIVVQVTVRASLSRSIQLTVSVMLGLIAAVVLGKLLGEHWWSIAIVVLAGLLAGELLRLGALSSQVAINGLLVVTLGSAYGYARIEDTVIGAAIGAVVNAFVAPPTYVQHAATELRRIGEDTAALLDDIAAGLVRRLDPAAVRRWLERARASTDDARVAEDAVSRGEESVRFNPRGRGELATLERLDEARLALEHALTQTRGIARSLLDLAGKPLSEHQLEALRGFGPVFAQAGVAVAAFGRLQEHPESVADRKAARAAYGAATEARKPLLRTLADLGAVDDAAARQLGALLVDADRLMSEIDVDNGAHVAAVKQA